MWPANGCKAFVLVWYMRHTHPPQDFAHLPDVLPPVDGGSVKDAGVDLAIALPAGAAEVPNNNLWESIGLEPCLRAASACTVVVMDVYIISGEIPVRYPYGGQRVSRALVRLVCRSEESYTYISNHGVHSLGGVMYRVVCRS